MRTRLRAGAASPAVPWVALAAVMAGALAVIMHAGRGTTFFYDDWPVILERRAWTLDNLLRPHVDHLQVFPTLVYKAMLETIGMHAHWAYRLLLAGLDVLTGVLLFAYARRRVGPWPALGVAAVLVLMADSWYNLIYPFQINFVGAMAAGLGMLLMLDRGDRRGDVLACVLLAVSIGCNSVGLPFGAAALIEVLLRPDRRQRWWIPVIPLGLWGTWRLIYGDRLATKTNWRNVELLPGWIMDALDDSAAAITGLTQDYRSGVALAMLAFVLYEATRPGRMTPRLAGLIAMPLVFWVLAGMSRADQGIQADENRYLYASGLMLGLVTIEAARRYVLSTRAGLAIMAVLLLGAAMDAHDLDPGGGVRLREWSISGKDAATAIDIAGEGAPGDLGAIDPTQGFIRVGPYLDAVHDYGPSPGFTRAELLAADPARKLGVDQALVRVHQMGLFPPPAGVRRASTVRLVQSATHGGVAGADRGNVCVRPVPEADDAAIVVEMPLPGLLIRAEDAEAEVRVHRFSTLWPQDPNGKVAAGTSAMIKPRGPDREPEPFVAQVRSKAPVVVCAVRG